MDANTERMPGDAEAAAAGAGLRDLYGRRLVIGEQIWWRNDEWPIGRVASGTLCGWRRGLLLVDLDGEIVEVEVDEILPF